jgi:predicted acylesterase/phospholipase RssA
LIADAAAFRGRHLLAYSLNVQLGYRLERQLERWCGVIPRRLRQLEMATFDRLHHGVRRLGIVCHDVDAARSCYFATGLNCGVQLHQAVRASASIPQLFPGVAVCQDDRVCHLTDGGVSDPVPVAFARGPQIGATHVIVSDVRWIGRVPAVDENTLWIRPRLIDTGTLWSPRRGLVATVRNGGAAVTDQMVERIRAWREEDGAAAAAAAG